MPTYEYVCDDCLYRFERFQGINDEPLKTCPKCGLAVRRAITGGAGMILKGKGFYRTDYGKKPCCDKDPENISSCEKNCPIV